MVQAPGTLSMPHGGLMLEPRFCEIHLQEAGARSGPRCPHTAGPGCDPLGHAGRRAWTLGPSREAGALRGLQLAVCGGLRSSWGPAGVQVIRAPSEAGCSVDQRWAQRGAGNSWQDTPGSFVPAISWPFNHAPSPSVTDLHVFETAKTRHEGVPPRSCWELEGRDFLQSQPQPLELTLLPSLQTGKLRSQCSVPFLRPH